MEDNKIIPIKIELDCDELEVKLKDIKNRLETIKGIYEEIIDLSKITKESEEPLILRCEYKISNIAAKEEELYKKLGRKVVILENGLELL